MKNPEAYIAKNKNRLRIYNLKTVFLENNDEFELEFFNPTTLNILAKIYINGILSSTSGLVLRPGERVFLDRYLDKVKKFKFETYDVENTSEVREAIRNNGLINVKFYNERTQLEPFVYTTVAPHYYYGKYYTPCATINYGGDGTFTCSSSDVISDQLLYCSDATSKIETGQVQEGNQSNQRLKNIDMDFDSYYFYEVEYQIKPYDNNKTIDSFAVYCTGCGYRKRKSQWKVCPICGEKFEF